MIEKLQLSREDRQLICLFVIGLATLYGFLAYDQHVNADNYAAQRALCQEDPGECEVDLNAYISHW